MVFIIWMGKLRMKLEDFIEELTREQIPTPPEFDEFFWQNFWDLLA